MNWFHKSDSAAQPRTDAQPDEATNKATRRTARASAKKTGRAANDKGGAPIVDQPAAPPHRLRLFTQLLFGFIVLSLATAFISGLLNIILVRNYVQDTSLDTLLTHAEYIAELAVRPGGSLKVITVQQLDEWEQLTGSQVIFINTDMSLITRQTLRNRRLSVTVAPETPTQAVPEVTLSPDNIMAEDDAATDDGADTADDDTELLSAIDFALVSNVLAGNTVSDIRSFDFMEGTWAFAGAPILSNGNVRGAVLLCQPLSSIDGMVRSISVLMSIAVSVSAVLSIMLAMLLTNRIVKPLARMTRAAQRIANGNYSERINASIATIELEQLRNSLNMLSGNLSTTMRSLTQEKIKMELVLSGIGEGIIAINQIGNMVHCNDAAVALLELHDEDAQLDVYHLTDRGPMIGLLIQVLEGGDAINGGWKNSKGQSIAASVFPILMGGDVVGAVGLVRDVSEAERLEQLRRDYVANISHELRTPLTGIRGMVEPLIDGVYDTEQEKQDCYNIIYQETRRLERLISDMLDISRLQDGRIHIELEEMQVNGIMEAAIHRLDRRAQDQGVALTIAEGADPTVMGNEDRILQVLIILIDNALKFTPAGGSITLQTRVADDMLWISVRDTGAGIAAEDLPYIFERFYKADKSRMETKGTGLGLAIARLVVELMGGTIWCESELGRGTKFEFSVHLAGWTPGADDAPSEWYDADSDLPPGAQAAWPTEGENARPAVIQVHQLSPTDDSDVSAETVAERAQDNIDGNADATETGAAHEAVSAPIRPESTDSDDFDAVIKALEAEQRGAASADAAVSPDDSAPNTTE